MTVESRDQSLQLQLVGKHIELIQLYRGARGKSRESRIKHHHHILFDVSYAFFGTLFRTSNEICKSS